MFVALIVLIAAFFEQFSTWFGPLFSGLSTFVA